MNNLEPVLWCKPSALLQSGSLLGLAAYLPSYQAEPAAAQRKGVRRSYTDVQAATVLKPTVQAAIRPGLLSSIVGVFLGSEC